MEDRSSKLQWRLAFWLFISLISVAALATLWEFTLEGIVLPWLGIPYDGGFETAERWRFVFTSTAFAILSILIPGWIIRRLLISLSQSNGEIMAARKETLRLARHDELTGLHNRRVFMERLRQALSNRETGTAVMIIDLDKFKPINDTFGHATGDEVLCELAERLRHFRREGISVARIGGDEFALLIDGSMTQDELALLASGICMALSLPLASTPHPVSAGVSIGIALAPQDANEPDLLLKCADTAMYHSKNTGRGAYRFYDPAYGEAVRARERFEREIIEAVQQGQFVPYFQPIVNLHSQQISGFEILARWHHPGRGLLMPADFIADVDRMGVMPALTEQMLRQSCRIALNWESHLTLAINVSASMIDDLGFPESLRQQLLEEHFPCSRLEIEITEEALITNLHNAKTNLNTFRAMGISVSLDDFGTGYSGLYHLTQLSIDKIKIDRSFIALQSSNKNQMVDAILAMGKSLEMQVTAEGIEKVDMAQWLAMHGCDFAQGYLFGKPVPGEVVPHLFNGTALKELSALLNEKMQSRAALTVG